MAHIHTNIFLNNFRHYFFYSLVHERDEVKKYRIINNHFTCGTTTHGKRRERLAMLGGIGDSTLCQTEKESLVKSSSSARRSLPACVFEWMSV